MNEFWCPRGGEKCRLDGGLCFVHHTPGVSATVVSAIRESVVVPDVSAWAAEIDRLQAENRKLKTRLGIEEETTERLARDQIDSEHTCPVCRVTFRYHGPEMEVL